MRRTLITVVLLGLAVAAAPARAAEADVQALIQEFAGEAEPLKRSQAELEAAHLQVLDALLPGMGAERAPDRQGPQQTYERIALRAGRPGAEAERQALCKAIAARLGPRSPLEARKWMLRLLVNVGREEVVPALAALLEDTEPILRERARRALQHNPSPKAAEALRTQLAKAEDPDWQAALINALAIRSGEATVQALIQQAKSRNETVRTAAVEALARMGAKAAITVIAAATKTGSPRARAVATDNYLLLADKLCAQGDRATARGMYRQLLGAGGHLRCAALIGLGRAGGAAELDTILQALDDKSPQVRGAALGALEILPTEDVVKALQARLKSAAPTVKVLLLRALARRAEKATVPVFLAAADDPSVEVRMAAYEALGKLGDDRAGPKLVAALLKAKDQETGAVTRSLVRIPGQGVTRALVQALDTAEAKGRLALVRCLVDRRPDGIVPVLLKAAEDENTDVRAEAFKGIGELGEAPVLPDLVARLVATKDAGARRSAERAIVAVARRVEDQAQRVRPMLAAYEKAEPEAQASLLRILGRLRGDDALSLVRKAAKAENATVQDAAVRALAGWDDPAVADDLIAIAKDSPNQTHRILALRGFITVVSMVRDRNADQMLQLYQSAMDAARRPEDKKMVLSGLARVNNVAALRMVQRYTKDPALKGEAVAALVRIARSIGGPHRQTALEALKDVPELTKDGRLRKQAQEAIEIIQRFDDYVVSWEAAGPYTQTKGGKSLFDYAFPPERQGAQDVAWQPLKVGTDKTRPWLVEFDKIFGGSNRVVYIRTRAFSPKTQKVRMELGSDDAVKLWLNGHLVHQKNVHRPCRPGEDKKPLTLQKGWNEVLMKVIQAGGQWAACLRFRTPQGKKLEGVYADVSGL